MSHKIGITACSNPMHPSFSADLARLCQILRELGFDPVLSPCLFDNGSGFSGTSGKEEQDRGKSGHQTTCFFIREISFQVFLTF